MTPGHLMDETSQNDSNPVLVKNSIIFSNSQDFNPTPILAEAYFKQIKNRFLKHADIRLSEGQRTAKNAIVVSQSTSAVYRTFDRGSFF